MITVALQPGDDSMTSQGDLPKVNRVCRGERGFAKGQEGLAKYKRVYAGAGTRGLAVDRVSTVGHPPHLLNLSHLERWKSRATAHIFGLLPGPGASVSVKA